MKLLYTLKYTFNEHISEEEVDKEDLEDTAISMVKNSDFEKSLDEDEIGEKVKENSEALAHELELKNVQYGILVTTFL